MSRPQDPISALVEQLNKLPGVGERTALRLVLHMLKSGKEQMLFLAQALEEVAHKVGECDTCCMLTADGSTCSVCRSPSRDKAILCVVASVQDMMALEATSEYRGLYHVLHGVLAPMEGIGPQQLRISKLMERLTDSASGVKELIIATPPTVEGEATALFVVEQSKPLALVVSRIASGVPVGGDLQFADRLTLSRAMQLRRGF